MITQKKNFFPLPGIYVEVEKNSGTPNLSEFLQSCIKKLMMFVYTKLEFSNNASAFTESGQNSRLRCVTYVTKMDVISSKQILSFKQC